jgi:hypothetical protein
MVLIPVIWNGIFQNFYKSWTVYYDIPIYSYQIVVGSPGALPKCAPYAFYTICFSAFVHAVSIQIWLCRKALHSLKMSHDNKKDHWSVICSEKGNIGVLSNATLSSSSFFCDDIQFGRSTDLLCLWAHPRDEQRVSASDLCKTSYADRLYGVCTYLCVRARTCVGHLIVAQSLLVWSYIPLLASCEWSVRDSGSWLQSPFSLAHVILFFTFSFCCSTIQIADEC